MHDDSNLMLKSQQKSTVTNTIAHKELEVMTIITRA
jgi:hypothetical protein